MPGGGATATKVIVLAIIFGALAGGLTDTLVDKYSKPSQEELRRDFYLVENAAHVSPHSIRKGSKPACFQISSGLMPWAYNSNARLLNS
ncbi:MAG: hypothetical protein A2788_01910 [Candidatus Abawacabacteria bacterium RIFCSPHIGHO2_01_FULL_46_8]|uniref:Uncharacterized protein n=1 Tax=Candidatus Abawacabacteria bacterium RIFCSPHIGHO2_01_FULL_46_8 TaxID=1817815 RepID=A0A1F4XJQ7_9BACT|nr:MAG: hypothetical protein A2788_01910 [Candidatus Abawacabacteria bacterium RIFCSPHIGHO2_01_FULL_46_8]